MNEKADHANCKLPYTPPITFAVYNMLGDIKKCADDWLPASLFR